MTQYLYYFRIFPRVRIETIMPGDLKKSLKSKKAIGECGTSCYRLLVSLSLAIFTRIETGVCSISSPFIIAIAAPNLVFSDSLLDVGSTRMDGWIGPLASFSATVILRRRNNLMATFVGMIDHFAMSSQVGYACSRT